MATEKRYRNTSRSMPSIAILYALSYQRSGGEAHMRSCPQTVFLTLITSGVQQFLSLNQHCFFKDNPIAQEIAFRAIGELNYSLTSQSRYLFSHLFNNLTITTPLSDLIDHFPLEGLVTLICSASESPVILCKY